MLNYVHILCLPMVFHAYLYFYACYLVSYACLLTYVPVFYVTQSPMLPIVSAYRQLVSSYTYIYIVSQFCMPTQSLCLQLSRLLYACLPIICYAYSPMPDYIYLVPIHVHMPHAMYIHYTLLLVRIACTYAICAVFQLTFHLNIRSQESTIQIVNYFPHTPHTAIVLTKLHCLHLTPCSRLYWNQQP